MADERCGGRGRAEVEGEECSRLTAHTVMLTGSQAPVAGIATQKSGQRCAQTRDRLKRPRSSLRPDPGAAR
jgi:hypothetical protein